MKATVPTLTAARAGFAHVAVGHIAIGPITVGQFVLRDAVLGVTAGHAELHNVTVTVTLHLDLEWHVHIGLPWPFDDIDLGGTDPLGTIAIPFTFGNAEIPSLHNINLNIPQLTGSNLTAQADPIADVRLNAVTADDIRAAGVTAPTAGITLSGFGLTSLAVDSVGVPAASIASASVAHAHGAPVSLPALVLRGLALPSAAANDISSAGLDLPLTREAVSLGLDLGLLRVAVKVTPSAVAHIDRLLLSGVQANATVGSIELSNVTLPYDALNITLADLAIETIDIPTIGLA